MFELVFIIVLLFLLIKFAKRDEKPSLILNLFRGKKINNFQIPNYLLHYYLKDYRVIISTMQKWRKVGSEKKVISFILLNRIIEGLFKQWSMKITGEELTWTESRRCLSENRYLQPVENTFFSNLISIRNDYYHKVGFNLKIESLGKDIQKALDIIDNILNVKRMIRLY